MSNILKDSIFIILGVACATLGLKGFLMPSHFIDGGTMGLSLLANQIFKPQDSL
jgi:uncharacterized membrane-anchored protein YitT (DUF2179 family)